MKLSGPKLRDRVDLWVAKFDPAGVRVPPKIDDNRYVEIAETTVGMAGIWANVHAVDAAARRADACGRWRAVKPVWAASAGHRTALPFHGATRPPRR